MTRLLFILILPLCLLGQTRSVINTGSIANDGTGDSLRTFALKSNTNFSTLWATSYTNGAGLIATNVTLIGSTLFDGNLTNGFELGDVDQLTLDGINTGVYGVQTLFLDGGITTLRGVTNLNLITPNVIAGTATNGQILRLSDASEGTVEFASFPSGIISGTSTLVSGASVVSNTNVTASSRIFLTTQSVSGSHGSLHVVSRVAGTSFTVNSSNGADASTFAWLIIQP